MIGAMLRSSLHQGRNWKNAYERWCLIRWPSGRFVRAHLLIPTFLGVMGLTYWVGYFAPVVPERVSVDAFLETGDYPDLLAEREDVAKARKAKDRASAALLASMGPDVDEISSPIVVAAIVGPRPEFDRYVSAHARYSEVESVYEKSLQEGVGIYCTQTDRLNACATPNVGDSVPLGLIVGAVVGCCFITVLWWGRVGRDLHLLSPDPRASALAFPCVATLLAVWMVPVTLSMGLVNHVKELEVMNPPSWYDPTFVALFVAAHVVLFGWVISGSFQSGNVPSFFLLTIAFWLVFGCSALVGWMDEVFDVDWDSVFGVPGFILFFRLVMVGLVVLMVAVSLGFRMEREILRLIRVPLVVSSLAIAWMVVDPRFGSGGGEWSQPMGGGLVRGVVPVVLVFSALFYGVLDDLRRPAFVPGSSKE